MLNYIWLALIVIGILVAVGNDWHDMASNNIPDDEQDMVSLKFFSPPTDSIKPESHYVCEIVYHCGRIDLTNHETKMVMHGGGTFTPVRAELIPSDEYNGIIHIFVDAKSNDEFKERFKHQNNPEYLAGYVHWKLLNKESYFDAIVKYDPVKFSNLKAVTNDGIIQSAKTAVELAIGLIGIMALWLGVMKIAEQSGLVAKLARALKPVTTRLFPDVPPDHPAMGAMIMNISANMLGLSNAATPLGLKAMEELNTLNKKLGTATDAMCTFLVINTSNVQLIPATVIAIRASAGSSNPAEILGSTLVATFVALIVGISTAKVLARLPFYKKQLQAGA